MLIAFSGKKQSGKDLARFIADGLINGIPRPAITERIARKKTFHRESRIEYVNFADTIKTTAQVLLKCKIEDLEDEKFKNSQLPPWWNGSPTVKTPRDLLQVLGTECGRNTLHPDIWVFSTMSNYTSDKDWIISDLRFPNEMKSIGDTNGLCIRINRPSKGEADTHESETALDNAVFDYVIENDGSIDKLMDRIEVVLIEQNLIRTPSKKEDTSLDRDGMWSRIIGADPIADAGRHDMWSVRTSGSEPIVTYRSATRTEQPSMSSHRAAMDEYITASSGRFI